MTRKLISIITLMVLSTLMQPATALIERPSRVFETDTVFVAPPTGERKADRANILSAIEKLEIGGTLQFAAGEYLMGGEIIRITVPRVTLTGHPEGTTLRGCHPDEFPMENSTEFGNNCNGLELVGGWQTVRNLTFEHIFWALHVGCCWDSQPHMMPGEDGHLIEGNTFRNNSNALRVHGYWSAPTVIRKNQLLNNWHFISVYGNTAHILDNKISVPEPEEVPGTGFPFEGIHIAIPMSLHESAEGIIPTCENNIISGNLIDGVTEGIMMSGGDSEITCRNNVIIDNTINIRRAHPSVIPGFIRINDKADSTVVGVPLALRGSFDDNLIEGNIIQGAEGLGIEIRGVSRNRIVNNRISNVELRKPFPGNAMAALPILGGNPETWRNANGSGIWVSPGSDGNEIIGNVFEDIATHAIVLGGAGNVVETDAGDAVRDLGSGNRVSGPAGAREPNADPLPSGIQEAGRLVFHQLLHPVGEETYTLTLEGDAYVLHADFSHNDRGQRTERSASLHLGLDFEPQALRLREIADGDTTETAVEVNGRLATVTVAYGSRRVAVPDRFFITTAFAPHAVLALLVRYWLHHGRPSSIPVLPQGNAVVGHVGLDTLEVAGETVALDRYHVDGVRWGGQTLWLDGEEQLVAAVSFDFNNQAVREGYEGALAFFSERARSDVLTRAKAASRHIAPLHTGTFALVGGTLVDGTGAPPLADATVVVSEGRIIAVGPHVSVTIPADAEVVDVTGTTLLPGLWDMHAHLAGITDFGPIYLAAGVTTVRDLGNETNWGLALREAFATGRIAGPRLLLAAEIDGRVPEAVGAIQADTPDEARALVRQFHELGFEQIKLYSRLRPELVPVIAEEAHRLGMTVTGHIPWGMSTIEALQAGMDQINHVNSVAAIGNMIPAAIRESCDVAGALKWLEDLDLDLETRSLIDTLVRHGTVVDPTLAAFELRSRPANVPLHEIEPGAARMPPIMANTIERWFPGRPAEIAELTVALHRKDVELVGILHRAGVPIVAGTDVVVPGHSLHRELELYVEAGMTPVEAIQAATIVPAREMGLDHDIGTVEVDKLADLILIDGDPTKNISDIRHVMTVIKDGRVYDPAAIYRTLGIEPCCEE